MLPRGVRCHGNPGLEVVLREDAGLTELRRSDEPSASPLLSASMDETSPVPAAQNLHSRIWWETFAFFTSLSKLVPPEKVVYSEVIGVSQRTMLGVQENCTINSAGVRSLELCGGNPDAPLLRSISAFLSSDVTSLPRCFRFPHYGSFLTDTSLNKKQGRNRKSAFGVAMPFLHQGASTAEPRP